MPGGGGGKGGKGGGATSRVEVVNSGTTNVDVDSTIELHGLDNINQTLTLGLPQPLQTKNTNELVLPQPFRTQSRQELAVTEPVVTDNRNAMSLDIRPVTVDLCLNVNTGPPAPACIRQPYHHHFGVTLFGIELMGLNFSGESQTIVQEMPRKPQVVWGGAEPVHHRNRHGASASSRHQARDAGGGPAEPRAGLRIRLAP